MAFAPYVRLVVQGTINSTQSWSAGMSFSNDGTATGGNLTTWLTTVDGLVKTWLGGAIAGSLWHTATLYNRLSAYCYPAVGGASTTASIFSSGVVGTNATEGPTQNAQCYSLRSGIAGRKGRGRFYIPVTATSGYSIGGQTGSTVITSMGSQFKTFVDAMNALNIGASPAVLCIASRDSGDSAPAQDVVLKSIIRTQRRRSDKIATATSSVVVF